MNTLRTLVVGLLPEGGQRTARQNAWAAMSDNARRARERRDVQVALAALQRPAIESAVHPH